MRAVNRDDSPEGPVDIRTVIIDRSQSVEERMRSFAAQVRESNQYRTGNTIIHVSYADTLDDKPRE